ncbi:uncharacterized protein DS421_7g219070 [Arachis hypogaea]|nr:uncharacterized protein DS421_7g219070 [Arachis hypogaea]
MPSMLTIAPPRRHQFATAEASHGLSTCCRTVVTAVLSRRESLRHTTVTVDPSKLAPEKRRKGRCRTPEKEEGACRLRVLLLPPSRIRSEARERERDAKEEGSRALPLHPVASSLRSHHHR